VDEDEYTNVYDKLILYNDFTYQVLKFSVYILCHWYYFITIKHVYNSYYLS